MERFLNMENCNFIDYPKGGQATVAKQIMNAYQEGVALVGITTDDKVPVGEWTKVFINGIEFDYFAVKRVLLTHKKPLVPKRIQMYIAFKKYKKEIFSFGILNVFTQSPEILFAIESLPWKSICVNMPGITNPLTNSRFKGVKYLANIFDYFYFKSLKKVDKILASADSFTINTFLDKRGKMFGENDIIHFPTRVETNIFKPSDKSLSKKKLGIYNETGPLFVVTGRLARVKGWNLIMDSFMEFKKIQNRAKLYFVGDGEDRYQMEKYIEINDLPDEIKLIGAVTREEVVLWINAADVILIGSFVEGWSLAMLESVACGKPIVTTDVSGARDMIENGVNGFICKERKPKLFSEYIENALELNIEEVKKYSIEIIERYALYHLKDELDKLWKR